VDGILNVDKPKGWTSFDVVAFVRKRSGVKRVGHAGTLDPAATGVLPILVGRATRVVEYLVDTTKTYRATVELGVETNTYDAEGQVVRREDTGGVERADIEAILSNFSGEIDQTPPAFSAIKRGGVPVYRLARAGRDVELAPRRVAVQRLNILRYERPFLELEIECGKGFYVRSLAHDLGAALGVGGTLSALRRTRVGTFSIDFTHTLDTLARYFEAGTWQELLWTPDEVLLGWPAAIIGDASATRLSQGQPLRLDQERPRLARPDRCRVYSASGDFVAIASIQAGGYWRPDKVFPLA
jgi:tRNA pseudouridine55 synthase